MPEFIEGIGGTVSFTGQIASDGTFEANDYKTLYEAQFSIRGTVPAPVATAWEGTYDVKNLSFLQEKFRSAEN